MSESNEHDSHPPGPDSPPHDSNTPSPPHESTEDKSTPSNSPPHDSNTPSPPPPSQAPPPKSDPPPPKSDSPAPKSSPSPKPSPPPASPPPSSPPPSSPSPSSPPPSSPPPSSSPPKSPSPPRRSPPPSSSKGKPTSGSSPPSPPASPPPPSSTDGNTPKPSSGDSSSSTSPTTDSSQDDKGSPSSPSFSQSPPSSPPPATTTTNPTAPSPPTVPSALAVPGSGATTTQPVPRPANSTPTLSPPSTRSQVTGDSGGSSRHTGTVVGLTVAGVFIIALVALIVVFVRKRKKQAQPYPPNYMPPTPGPHGGNLSTPGGYYHAQQQSSATSGPTESFYSSGPPGPSSYENSYQGNPPSSGDSGLIAATKVHFTYEELMEITNRFSRQNVIGEGGFGCVYKGWMPDGRIVAVKQLKAGSGQGEKEFRAEVEIISRVHHRYLVSLVGYCISEQQRLLIYEFVPNKTLEHHLHGAGMPVLEWTKRLKIALGSAKGLAYLHEDCHPKIIHRDIKSANILLDDAFEAQVADFGLAKLTDGTNTHVSTRVMGTFGYMAPEYANSGKLTDRSDVFSFGVVLLELVTGRKPVDSSRPLGDESLVEWARPLLIQALETGDLSKLVDPRLEKHYVEGEMFRMIEAAAACVRHSAPKRPRMAQVVRALDCEGELSDLTNGVKVGQSTAYDSGQYNKDIMRFRRMALGSGGSSEMSSADFTSREVSGPQSLWTRPDASSDESETRAFTTRGGEQIISGNQGRRF